MCEVNNITNMVRIGYLIFCFAIPIIYLIIFACIKRRKKNYVRAFFIAILMFIILFLPKIVVSLDIGIFQCANVYLNGESANANEGDDDTIEVNNDKTNKTTTTSTTTTTTQKVEYTYKKLSMPEGERIDKGKTSKGFDITEINGITYIDGYLMANKTYFLTEDYVPDNTYTKADGNATKQCATCINNIAYNAWKEMKADAKALSLNIYISSGFRSFVTQRNIYNRNVNKNGQASADTYSARPGSSEHQTGLAFDLNTIDSSFAKTAEGRWVAENAHRYGYIIRYPKGKTNKTGYIYEPWHLRYVGSELAEKLYNNGEWLSMEEYFGITSSYE